MTTPNADTVQDFFARYLRGQVDAHRDGLGFPAAGDAVTPFDATPVQPVDPRLAWADAVTAGQLLAPTAAWAVPPGWPDLVAQQEPAVAIAFGLGNFPQLVRHVLPLLTSTPTALRQETGSPLDVPGILDWAKACRDEPMRLLAAGVLRLARQFDLAEALLAGPNSDLNANERAALAWHRGHGEQALTAWRAQKPSIPVLFNRGMAALFLGQPETARADLDAAIALLPEASAWHHLASLYRAMADIG